MLVFLTMFSLQNCWPFSKLSKLFFQPQKSLERSLKYVIAMQPLHYIQCLEKSLYDPHTVWNIHKASPLQHVLKWKQHKDNISFTSSPLDISVIFSHSKFEGSNMGKVWNAQKHWMGRSWGNTFNNQKILRYGLWKTGDFSSSENLFTQRPSFFFF